MLIPLTCEPELQSLKVMASALLILPTSLYAACHASSTPPELSSQLKTY